jgi:hypothetical protein
MISVLAACALGLFLLLYFVFVPFGGFVVSEPLFTVKNAIDF